MEYLLGHKEGIKIVNSLFKESKLSRITLNHYTQAFIEELKRAYDNAFSNLLFDIHTDDNPTPHIFPTPAKNKYPAH
mgnify:CR=1 FL=1